MEPVLLLCLAGGTAFSAVWLRQFRRQISISSYAILPLSILHTALGVLCVCLFAGLEAFRLTISGGMSLYGAVFLLPLFYWAGGRLFHRDLKQVFDILSLCMISTLMLTRINCIASGCCQGLPLPGSSGLRWPTREAEIIFHGILLVIFYRRVKRQEKPGTIYPIYMLAYGVFRFFEEWFRVGDTVFLGLHPAHIWSVLAVIIGWSVYTEQKNRSRKKAAREKNRR